MEPSEMTVMKKQSVFHRVWALLQKYMGPIFVSLILLVGHWSFGIMEDIWTVLIAVGAAVAVDLVFGRLYFGKWKNASSGYITGNSVAILIRSTFVWPYALTSAISILSKYVFRYKGRHLWNPSNFGISWMLLTSPSYVAGLSVQWGNNLWPMLIIWVLGIVIVHRAKKLHVTAVYVISFVAFALIRSQITEDPFLAEVAPLTGPMYQLFIFFMITDPPTNVRSKKGQMLVAFLVALMEFVLRLNQLVYAPFYALAIVGPVAKFIDLKMSREKKAS